jgi:predicted protein tyrosine phosphatase
MIETVKITDLDGALQLARSYSQNYTAWISLLDPEDEKDCFNIKRLLGRRDIPHFHRFFRDYDEGEIDVDIHGPSLEDVDLIINFLRTLKNQDQDHFVGINCLAGVSRSSAVGVLAWMIQGFCPEIALDKVLHVRRQAWPNTRILKFYDEIAGTNSYEVVCAWKQENKGKLFTNTAWT